MSEQLSTNNSNSLLKFDLNGKTLVSTLPNNTQESTQKSPPFQFRYDNGQFPNMSFLTQQNDQKISSRSFNESTQQKTYESLKINKPTQDSKNGIFEYIRSNNTLRYTNNDSHGNKTNFESSFSNNKYNNNKGSFNGEENENGNRNENYNNHSRVGNYLLNLNGGDSKPRQQKVESNNTNNTMDPAKSVVFNNFGNDYSDHFVRTGILPQAHVQNAEIPLVGYPRLQKLHDLKATHTRHYACTPYTSSLSTAEMPHTLHTWATSDDLQFDVILVGGCLPYALSLNTLASLPIPQLTPRPSLALVWVPSHGLDIARQALEIWGFRRSEDIVYMCRSRESIFYPPQHEEDVIEKSTWHCLMGLKGTLRRSEDTDLINCNVDTDIIMETSDVKPNIVPEQIYTIIENFSLMSRRLHIIPGNGNKKALPVNPRPGWVIVSPDCQNNNFMPQDYMTEMRVLGHRVPIDTEIDILRPKTPPRAKKGNQNTHK